MTRPLRWVLPIAYIGCFAIADVVVLKEQPAAELAVEMQADQPSLAKVYFDTGAGFNETESASRHVAGDSISRVLLFALPLKPVRSIRFDPLEVGGVVRIRALLIEKPDSHVPLAQLDPLKVAPANEITSIRSDGTTAEITIPAEARDPQLLLPLTAPLDIHHSAADLFSHSNLKATILFFFLAALVIGVTYQWPKLERPIRAVSAVFDSWCRRLARSGPVVLDRLALWFYTACVAAFVLFCLGKLHGSSLSIAGASYRGWTDTVHTPLLGTPKKVRSDEWSFHTPTILNQLYRHDPLAVNDTLLGPDKAALVGNVPCRHFTQFFRPQFWSFFVLPVDFAFSVYWQSKALLLLTGVFTLVLLLTRSSSIAAISALWYFFSAYTQWAYSWASLLPEMVGLFCWTIALTCYLMVGRNRILLILGAIVCAGSAINFALCAYPPHQVPLMAFGLAIVAGWAWSHRKSIWQRDKSIIRCCSFFGCWLFVAAVMLWFYFDARETLLAGVGTVYPGQRSNSGGGISITQFLSHFLDFWKSEGNFPPVQGNICEASGYLWLAPLTLLLARPPKQYRFAGALLFSSWAAFLVILCWVLLPIPAEVGRWLMFNRVPPFRCYHALGLINVVIVGLFFAERTKARESLPMARTDWLRGLAAAVILMVLFPRMNRALGQFFSTSAIATAGVYILVLVLLLVYANKKAFAACLLVPLVLANSLINPLDRGLAVITSSSLFKMVQGDRRDWREGKWLIYAPWADEPGLLAATGIDVIDCLKIIPDQKRMATFDPDGLYSQVINRSSYFFAIPLPPNEPSSFDSPVTGNVLWKVNPLDPRLRQIGVDRVVFAYQPPTAEYRQQLAPFFEASLPGLQIYHLH